jgi:hypothetical protein
LASNWQQASKTNGNNATVAQLDRASNRAEVERAKAQSNLCFCVFLGEKAIDYA